MLDDEHRREFVSERQANHVAKVLAPANPGKRFYVYECQTVVIAGAVILDL